MNRTAAKVITSAVGGTATFLAVQPEIAHEIGDQTTETLVVTIVTILGGFLSQLLTPLLGKLFKKRKNKEPKTK